MRGIAKALLSDDPTAVDRAVNLETLRYAVQRKIFCDKSGALLDVRRAVMITVTIGDQTGAKVVTGDVWDDMADAAKANIEAIDGARLEIIDGRKLR